MPPICDRNRTFCGARSALWPVVLGLALATAPALAAGPGQTMSFESPEAAVGALRAALEKDDVDALLGIFGHEYPDELIGTDKIAAREGRKRFFAATQEMYVLRVDDADTRVLVVGAEAWPFPIPIVRKEHGWNFDTDEGIEEIITRRVGRNELDAIEIARAYVSGQIQYARTDRDGDQVREYAQRLGSTAGGKDGLYWEAAEGEEQSPFGPLVAEAQDYLEGRESGDPFKGYYYKILTRQGQNPPGGRYDYIINGNMIAGFALLAFPADYGLSGIMAFVVSHQGKVYQKDLGENTRLLATDIHKYDPDETWKAVTKE